MSYIKEITKKARIIISKANTLKKYPSWGQYGDLLNILSLADRIKEESKALESELANNEEKQKESQIINQKQREIIQELNERMKKK